MARFVLDGHAYEGPEPAGAEGLALYDRVMGVLSLLNFGDLTEAGSLDDLRRILKVCRAIGAGPHGRELFFQTFAGWTVDGHPVSQDMYARTYGQKGRWSEPGQAMMRCWMDAGFFHVVGGESESDGPREVDEPAA